MPPLNHTPTERPHIRLEIRAAEFTGGLIVAATDTQGAGSHYCGPFHKIGKRIQLKRHQSRSGKGPHIHSANLQLILEHLPVFDIRLVNIQHCLADFGDCCLNIAVFMIPKPAGRQIDNDRLCIATTLFSEIQLFCAGINSASQQPRSMPVGSVDIEDMQHPAGAKYRGGRVSIQESFHA